MCLLCSSAQRQLIACCRVKKSVNANSRHQGALLEKSTAIFGARNWSKCYRILQKKQKTQKGNRKLTEIGKEKQSRLTILLLRLIFVCF